MNHIGDKVQVIATGCIVGLSKQPSGTIKYEIADDDTRIHCWVYAENLTTIHEGELNAAANQN